MDKTLHFFFELVRANAMIARRLSVHGLDFTDFMILHSLDEAPQGRLRRVDLAACLGLTASGITRMILPLEKTGFVRREADDKDARARYASLTPDGKRLLADATATIAEKTEDILPPELLPQIENLTATLVAINKSPSQ